MLIDTFAIIPIALSEPEATARERRVADVPPNVGCHHV